MFFEDAIIEAFRQLYADYGTDYQFFLDIDQPMAVVQQVQDQGQHNTGPQYEERVVRTYLTDVQSYARNAGKMDGFIEKFDFLLTDEQEIRRGLAFVDQLKDAKPDASIDW